jgi:hypothetical protein
MNKTSFASLIAVAGDDPDPGTTIIDTVASDALDAVTGGTAHGVVNRRDPDAGASDRFQTFMDRIRQMGDLQCPTLPTPTTPTPSTTPTPKPGDRYPPGTNHDP